ncbi:hypothetical protein [Pseudalkalibacillus berkeleyi]|uniref:Nitroreductase domain-containing protein n=1 Tax=Pseudalkalibacillus berkeleyi TaxID=1069813 RepID=A0ABS9GY07_9BACL|nr:hypothetical protein [Pseudalkalibacillus berkeleyi]MCF6136514.1 hypothetical protein [Pseudalkalibacillus berkeleyi]
MNKGTVASPSVDIFKKKRDVFFAEAIQDKILDEKTLHAVTKFHQSTSWHMPFNWGLDEDTQEWMDLVENTDVLPENVDDEIVFDRDTQYEHQYGSSRNFKLDYAFSKYQVGKILENAFGRTHLLGSKPYPSAGALYPVIPLLFVLDSKAIEDEGSEGCYVYDSTNHKLLLIKSFTTSDIEKLKRHLCPNDGFFSHLAMGYAIDFKRAITKYKKRGYRHGLIEVGLMAQSFRHSLDAFPDMGEFCWSGFNDNALTHLAGLNPKLAPITLMQWFGMKR